MLLYAWDEAPLHRIVVDVCILYLYILCNFLVKPCIGITSLLIIDILAVNPPSLAEIWHKNKKVLVINRAYN